MADLEELAIKRDRGYLVRLVLMLCVGMIAGVFLYRGLTGEGVTGCVADALLGQDKQGAAGAGSAAGAGE
jgi:hypothetical protein